MYFRSYVYSEFNLIKCINVADLTSKPSELEASMNADEAIKFTYRNATRELSRFFDRWCTISHSRHTYAKIYTYETTADRKVQMQGTSFCVIRLSWEAKNLCILNLFFFNTTPEDRIRIVDDIKTELVSIRTIEVRI